MALDTELLENIHATVETELTTILVAGGFSATKIYYEGMNFDTTKTAEWVRSQSLGHVPIFARQRSSTTLANISSWMHDFSAFVKTGQTTNIRRHLEIRDLIAAGFPINKHMPIMNYNGDGLTEIGRLRVEEFVSDRPLIEDDGVIGWVLTLRFAFIYEFTKP